MQQLQISRGKLSVRREHDELLNGELFIDYTRSEKYDLVNSTSNQIKDGNTYELYTGIDGKAVKIGGQGVLSFIRATSTALDGTGLPTNPVTGGIYYVSEDIELVDHGTNNPSGHNFPEFRAGDLAIYLGEKFHNNNVDPIIYRFGGVYEEAPGWLRINNGGGAAYEVVFDNSYTNLTADNVQEAIVELDRHKLAYGGIKFKQTTVVNEKDLINDEVVTTGDNNFIITKSELFDKIKPGYYYSVGTLASNTNITIQVSNDESIKLEEGDFLAVYSDVTTNDTALEVDDIKIVKIAGGTHDSERINYEAGPRNDSYINSGDNDSWTEVDNNVHNVKQALDDLFKSKADLTDDGKIPLTQLPDTLIGSMEYQGTYVLPDEESFDLPSATDKVTRTDESTEVELVQGDYWIYTGRQINIQNEGFQDEIESIDGHINSGDWLVYNGVGNKWTVVDNTSPISSLTVRNNKDNTTGDSSLDEQNVLNQETILQGDIKIEGSYRSADADGNELKEIILDTDNKSTLTISSENAVLLSDDNKAEHLGTFYKDNGSKTLKATGVSETDDGELIIDESKGLTFTGGVQVGNEGITGDDGTSYDPNQILNSNISQNPTQASHGDIDILLPAHSGTLATLDDVGLSNGTNFFIPRVREDDDGTRSFVDSPIELIDHAEDSGDSDNLIGFVFHSKTAPGRNQRGKFNADISVIFRGEQDNEGTEPSIHVMPRYSGIILNTNSVIDCGEWDNDGLHLEHEGSQNTTWSSAHDIQSSTYYNALKSGMIPSWSSTEYIDAIIEDGGGD